MEFAIVDIETTGGHASGNSITEVSIQLFDGEQVVKRFETLINPEADIPYYITGLTGITNQMVKSAPKFEQVAAKIFEMLNGRIFVAHAVNFDYSFLKNHLKNCGYELQARKLCTVRLSRKIFPGFPSYSLGNLCSALDIPLNNRHRAGGDAEATVILFKRLLDTDSNTVYSFLKRGSKEQALPPHLPKQEFESLPDTPGVYYFQNKKGKVVYVGKAVNIKKRVSGHFSNNSPGKQKQDFMRDVYHIRYTQCPTEQDALKLETREIKRLWPLYNRAQKGYEPLFGIVHYYDQNGFGRLAVKKLRNKLEAAILVKSVLEGHELLRNVVGEFDLCLRLAGIPRSKEYCEQVNCICCQTDSLQVEEYNHKTTEAMQLLKETYTVEAVLSP